MRKKKIEKRPSVINRNFTLYIIFFFVTLIVFDYVASRYSGETLGYQQFVDSINDDKIKELTISDNRISGILKEDKEGKTKNFNVVPVNDDQLIPKLLEKKIPFKGVIRSGIFTTILSWVLPFAIFYFLNDRRNNQIPAIGQ